MTPEERAKQCILSWRDSGQRELSLAGEIANAIRAAENDALERAASMCDEATTEEYLVEERGIAEALAGGIRFLKHHEP